MGGWLCVLFTASWRQQPKTVFQLLHLYSTTLVLEDARECPLNLFAGALLRLYRLWIHGKLGLGYSPKPPNGMPAAPSYSSQHLLRLHASYRPLMNSLGDKSQKQRKIRRNGFLGCSCGNLLRLGHIGVEERQPMFCAPALIGGPKQRS